MLTMIASPISRLVALAAFAAIAICLVLLAGMGGQVAIAIALTAAGAALVMRNRTAGPEGPAGLASPDRPAPPDLLDMAGFTQILDGLHDPMLVLDDGRVVMASTTALGLLGEHILGSDARIAIRHPAAAELFGDRARIDAPTSIDIVGLGAREQRWTMNVIPIDTGNRSRRRLVHLVDQSARHAVERARVDFVANASHELRTPLAAILGFVETLSDPEVGDDRPTRARFLGIVESEARRMQQLVDDLMSLSRIEADKHRPPDTPVDLAALAREALQALQIRLGPRGADLRLEMTEALPGVLGDAAQLSQLLHNLIDNAAKYGRAGTPVVVSIRPAEGAMLSLTVRDHGEGVAAEHLPRLTERFYRVDSGRSRTLGGTGLGLALVKHIVERHRGRLHIASTPGEGTTVTVLLPAMTGSDSDAQRPLS